MNSTLGSVVPLAMFKKTNRNKQHFQGAYLHMILHDSFTSDSRRIKVNFHLSYSEDVLQPNNARNLFVQENVVLCKMIEAFMLRMVIYNDGRHFYGDLALSQT